jgi:hypothetical protein
MLLHSWRSTSTIITFTLVFILIGCQSPKQTPISNCNIPINNALWPTLVANGKGDSVAYYQLPATKSPLAHYYTNVLQLDAELAYSCQNDSAMAKQLQNNHNYISTYIGSWNGFLVFQISNTNIGHRSILLKGCDSLFRILYTELAASYPKPTHPEQLFPIPKLLPYPKTTFLQIEQYIGGNQLPYATHFWTIDSSSNLPSYINTISKL